MHGRILGGILLVLGVLKASHPSVFLRHIGSLDLPLTSDPSFVGWGIIALEVGLGAALLLGSRNVIVAAITLACTLGTLGFVILDPGNGRCGCFGSAFYADFGRRLAVSALTLYLTAVHALDLIRSRPAADWIERREEA